MTTPEAEKPPEHHEKKTPMAALMERALDTVVLPQRDTKAAAIRGCAAKINALREAGATWTGIGNAIRDSGVTVSDDQIRRVMEAYNARRQNGARVSNSHSYADRKNSKPSAIT